MRLISWNVNGLRSCLDKGFMDFFNEIDADIFCVQEIKMLREQWEREMPGYLQYWNSAEKKGYSGTAVFSRIEPLTVSYGMGVPEHDREGRLITLELEAFFLVNCYTPNSKRELLRLDNRMEWEDEFRRYLTRLAETKPVVLCGDLNVAHREIDIKNAKSNVKNAGFTPQEREKMTTLLDSGFVDTYRYLNPEKIGAYTWWSYFANARERNIGWRIDYFIVSEGLSGAIADAMIYDGTMGSDHCPVGLELNI